jgi:anti-anti-sigma factor
MDSATLVSRECDRTVIWLRGEHDIATTGTLAATLRHAIRADEGDVVLDLRRVTFLDAATVGVLVEGRNILEAEARRLTLRAPSPRAMHVLAICGLAHLVDIPRSEPLERTVSSI